jgi:uncharacterized Zn-binding protein involved in type VI secretion
MGQPAARVGDMHVCPMITPGLPPVPHVGGPILPPGGINVLIGGMPAAVVGTMCVCVGPPDSIVKGSLGVMIGGKPATRMGDMTAHGGTIIIGLPTVLIGEIGGGAGSSFAVTMDGADVKFGNIVIKPDPDDPSFQAKVVADLRLIEGTPTGKALLQSVNGSGKTVTIQRTTGGNSCNSASFIQGKGANDATIHYNPEMTKIGIQDWETRPPAIGLAHELGHADQATNGTNSFGKDANDSKPNPADPDTPPQADQDELETAGIPPHDTTYPYNENKIRSEWKPVQPQREWY